MMDCWIVVTAEPDADFIAVASTKEIAEQIARDHGDAYVSRSSLFLSIEAYEESKKRVA